MDFFVFLILTACNAQEAQNINCEEEGKVVATVTAVPSEGAKPTGADDTSKPTATPNPTAAPMPKPTATPEPKIVTLTISAAGDVTLGNTHLQGYDGTFRKEYDVQQNPGYFFEKVRPILEADDMTIVNFEGVLTLSNERVEKAFNLKGDPEYIDILTEGSVEAVSFGNNHRMDYGQQGSDDTVAMFEKAGIAYAYDEFVGTYEVNGLTVGFVSVNEHYDGIAVEAFLEDGIKQLQHKEVDLIIACCHWGVETHHYIDDVQGELGRKCIDWGADLVLGHHPHVLQGIEKYNDRYIVYSLGNFCFGGNKNPKNKETMIFQKTFTFVDGEVQLDDNIQIIPCYISSVKKRNNFQPIPAEGEEAKKIIDHINQYSKVTVYAARRFNESVIISVFKIIDNFFNFEISVTIFFFKMLFSCVGCNVF